MKDLILIGIQGSGKGTQAKILATKKGYEIFETGGVLRKVSQENSPLGKKIKAIMDAGDLVSNEVVMEMVTDFLRKLPAGKSVIFDGIPRSEVQRISLEKLLAANNRHFEVLSITLSEKEVYKRLSKRAEIEGRSDDNEKAITKRIENFKTHTQPLLETWQQQNKVKAVCGEHSVEEVTRHILEILEK